MEAKVPIIKFKNITKVFNHQTVLYDLSLDIFANEIVVLLGRSGCGKSTLLKILIGFYPPDEGNIYYNTYNLTRNYERIRSIAGYVSQENSFYEKLTVEENLRFFASLYHVNRKVLNERIDELLALVNLTSAKKVLADKISGGMKRRLEFAIALIHDPKLLILDEPFTGLDIKIRDELWNVVKKIKSSGVTIIISTHLLHSSQKNCDRVVILNKNKVVENFLISPQMRDLNCFNLEEKFLEVIK